MGSLKRSVTVHELQGFEKQFRALHKDWHYFYKLIEAYRDPRADSERRRALEMAFLELKGRISCDYPVLTTWRSGACGIPAGISDVFSNNTSLKSLVDGQDAGSGLFQEEWQIVDNALGYVRQVLGGCREKTKPGREARIPAKLIVECQRGEALKRQFRMCTGLKEDWRRLQELIVAYLQPGADRSGLEAKLLQLKTKIATEYPCLPSWFSSNNDVSTGLVRILSSGATLSALSAGYRNNGRTHRDLAVVDESIAQLWTHLSRARVDLASGKTVKLPQGVLVQTIRPPFPWKKVITRIAIVGTIVSMVAGTFFMRFFLGIGAPAPGAGMAVSASMEDEDQAMVVLSIMNEAFVDGSVDSFMTAIARDFEDDVGNGRRALRLVLQAYHTQGKFSQARVIWSQAEFTRQDEWIYAHPVIIQTNIEGEKDIYIKLGFKQSGDRWLISSAEGYN